MSLAKDNLTLMAQQGAMRLLMHAIDYNALLADRGQIQRIAYTLYNLSTDPANHADIVTQGGVRLCCKFWRRCDLSLDLNCEELKPPKLGEDVREVVACTIANLACGRVNSARMHADGAGAVLCTFILQPEQWMNSSDVADKTGVGSANMGELSIHERAARRRASGRKAAMSRLPRQRCAAALRSATSQRAPARRRHAGAASRPWPSPRRPWARSA